MIGVLVVIGCIVAFVLPPSIFPEGGLYFLGAIVPWKYVVVVVILVFLLIAKMKEEE